jgi:hypothetical protein
MLCPPEIAKIVHEILRIGIMRIRACGWNCQADRCAIEADHLHNLPALLTDYRPEMLEFYLRVERLGYTNRSNPEEIASFQPLWTSLTALAEPAKKAGRVIIR